MLSRKEEMLSKKEEMLSRKRRDAIKNIKTFVVKTLFYGIKYLHLPKDLYLLGRDADFFND